MTKKDLTNKISPKYYLKHIGNLYVSCLEIIEMLTKEIKDPIEAFCIGNVIKYIWRYKEKNGVEDLRKAQNYLHYIITKMECDNKCKNHTEDGTTHTGCAST